MTDARGTDARGSPDVLRALPAAVDRPDERSLAAGPPDPGGAASPGPDPPSQPAIHPGDRDLSGPRNGHMNIDRRDIDRTDFDHQDTHHPGIDRPDTHDPGIDRGADDRVGSRDGGVTARLSRRCRIAAAALLGVAAACLLPVVLRGWDPLSGVLALVALVALLGGVAMWRRWALWTAVAGARVPVGPWITATTGDPRALSPHPTGSPIKRRYGAVVLPLRADSGPTPGDGALIVHARADGAAPAAGDRLRVVPVARRGDPFAAASDAPSAVRVLLLRDSDGAVFVATTRVTDTW